MAPANTSHTIINQQSLINQKGLNQGNLVVSLENLPSRNLRRAVGIQKVRLAFFLTNLLRAKSGQLGCPSRKFAVKEILLSFVRT